MQSSLLCCVAWLQNVSLPDASASVALGAEALQFEIETDDKEKEKEEAKAKGKARRLSVGRTVEFTVEVKDAQSNAITEGGSKASCRVFYLLSGVKLSVLLLNSGSRRFA